MSNWDRVYKMAFASVYPQYVRKAEAKGRTKAEVDEIIRWLTGHSQESLGAALAATIYFGFSAYRRRQGIDVDKVYQAIPVE